MNKKVFIVILIIVIIAVLAFGVLLLVGQVKNALKNNSNNASSTEVIVGGDKDAHGCIGSAGYTWCEAKNKCLKTWEEECSSSGYSYFDKTGNLVFSSSTWSLIYEESGKPALKVSLSISITSLCLIGDETKFCDEYMKNFKQGDRVEVVGYLNNKTVSVSKIISPKKTVVNQVLIDRCVFRGGRWYTAYNECEGGITQTECTSLGGQYNQCASVCRHDPSAQVCNLLCVPVCRF